MIITHRLLRLYLINYLYSPSHTVIFCQLPSPNFFLSLSPPLPPSLSPPETLLHHHTDVSTHSAH